MSGGVYEYTMGVFANASGNLWSGNSTNLHSGFNGLVGEDGTEYNQGIPFPTDTKYYNKYQASDGTTISSNTACDGGICYGHALSETEKWYSNYAYFVSSAGPWLDRGGDLSDGVYAGAFSFSGGSGFAGSSFGFRSSVVVP